MKLFEDFLGPSLGKNELQEKSNLDKIFLKVRGSVFFAGVNVI